MGTETDLVETHMGRIGLVGLRRRGLVGEGGGGVCGGTEG